MTATAAKTTKPHSATVTRSGPFFKGAQGPAFFTPVQRKATAGAPPVQAKLAVSKPNDPLEKEADRTADKVMRMPAEQVQRAAGAEGQVQRFGIGGSPVGTPASSEIHGATTGGQPLSSEVRGFMEPRLGADLGNVRVHTGETASGLSNQLSARAFTYRNHIFFGQDQYQPGTGAGRHLLAHELTHTIQQGATVQRAVRPGGILHTGPEVQRAPQVTTGTEPPTVQRWGLDDIPAYFAGKAHHIPGYRMLTLVIGFDPITMAATDRSAANLLRALIELVPGGGLVTQALDNHGVINKAAAWVEAKIAQLGDIGGQLVSGIKRFIKSLSITDLGNIDGVWERAKNLVLGPIRQLISFGVGVVSELLDLVKQAILRPLAALAEGTSGYDLLKAVLGQDPITGDAVPRTADTLIGGFMKLIGQEEVWNNLKQGRAVERAFAWFQSALSELMGFVRSIPTKIVETLTSLTFEDVITVVGAFRKIGSAFLDVASQFGSWAMNKVIDLLEILFSVVAPGVLPYIAKARAAFTTILKDPIGFVGNLVRAGKLGFQQFAGNILNHLKAALIKWLVGPLAEAGVYIPTSFSLIEIVKLVLSVLGLTWQNIRGKLVRIIPEPILVGLERTAGVLVTLATQGPAAAWEQIKGELTQLKDQLIAQVTQMISIEVVKAAVMKLVSMLNPAGAVVQAIIAIYNTVTFFIEKASQIGAVVASFIDSISAIASGAVGAAAKRVEETLARTLVVVIGFLAKFAGLGGIPAKLVGIVKKVRQPIDRGLDKIVAWLGKMLAKGAAAAKSAAAKLLSWWTKKVPVSGGGESHTLTFQGERSAAKLVLRSSPEDPEVFIERVANKAQRPPPEREAAVATTKRHAGEIRGMQKGLEPFHRDPTKTATGDQVAIANAIAKRLDRELAMLASFIGRTLAKWLGEGDPLVGDLTFPRREFSYREKKVINKMARGMGEEVGKLVTLNKETGELRVARRHVISADDMGKHYGAVLSRLKVSQAKLLLEQRGAGAGARVGVSDLTVPGIFQAALARYNAFFGYAHNLFLGDFSRNSSLGAKFDPDHPQMTEPSQRDDYVFRIKREWALDGSLRPTGWKRGT